MLDARSDMATILSTWIRIAGRSVAARTVGLDGEDEVSCDSQFTSQSLREGVPGCWPESWQEPCTATPSGCGMSADRAYTMPAAWHARNSTATTLATHRRKDLRGIMGRMLAALAVKCNHRRAA
jgi:hypothetical protein